jgi:hypothetical protein
MIDLGSIYPQERRYRIMPLTSDKNKTLNCLICRKKDDAIRKYGWLWCRDCENSRVGILPALGDYTVH